MISFDLGSTLETERPLQALVRVAIVAGIPVAVISATGPQGENNARKRVENLGLGIPQENVFIVFWKAEPGERPTPAAMIEAGREKGRVALRIGASVHFDDSEHVAQGMREMNAPVVLIRSSDGTKKER